MKRAPIDWDMLAIKVFAWMAALVAAAFCLWFVHELWIEATL